MSEELNVFKSPESFHDQLKAIQPIAESKAENSPAPQQEMVDETPDETSSETHETSEAPDATEDVQASDAAPKKENKYVPRSRLKEESEKRQALEGQLMKEREDRIRFETQVQMMQQMHNANNAQPVAQEPDLDHIDPLDLESHNVYSKKIKHLEEKIKNIESNTSKQTEHMYLYNQATAQEAKFKTENPDYESALKHLVEIETSDAELEYGPNEARRLAAQKLERIIRKTLNDGGNSADTLYKMAVKKGYQPSKGEKAASETPRGSNLGKIDENMKKSASIGNLGTGVGMSPSSQTVSIDKLRKDPKNPRSKFDPEKFHRQLQQIN